MNKNQFMLSIFLLPCLFICNPSAANIIEQHEEQEVPATEDLMYEHGILNRLLLIFEKIIGSDELHVPALKSSLEILQSFIQNFHEKLEENYIFPLFEKNNKEIGLVKTLKRQHTKGRDVTKRLQTILDSKDISAEKFTKEAKSLLKKFVDMYRPHEAREDTILFPQVRSLLTEKEFEELGETFEELELKLFGKNAHATMLDKIIVIEKELGIYSIEQFTPQVD